MMVLVLSCLLSVSRAYVCTVSTVENHESFGFFYFEPKKCFQVPTPWGLYGAEWDKRCAVYAIFSLFCYVGNFGDLGDPVLPTLRGVSRDVVTVCQLGYEGAFFYSL